MAIKKIGKSIILILLMSLSTLSAQEKISISASVDKSKLILGDYVEYRIEVAGTNRFNSNNIQLPSIPNFQRMNNAASTSRNTSIVNGRASHKTILTYYLKPQKKGKLTIPSFTLRINNKDYPLKAITIEVVESDQKASKVRYVFVKQTVNTTKPYQYQEITVSYLLYIHPQVNVDNISILNSPSNTGVWKESYEITNNIRQLPSDLVDGLQYKVYLVGKEAMFPTIVGPFTIQAPEYSVQINRVDRRSQRRQNSLFDLFGNQRIRETLNVKPNEYKIDVQPLSYSGSDNIDYSGTLKLDISINKTAVETNDALNLVITMSGTGNISSLKMEDFYISPDIEKYEPNLRTKVNKDGNRISGFKRIEYALVPRVPGKHKIGPFKYTYWNVEQKKAITLEEPAIEIVVDQGKSFASANSGGAVAAKRDVARLDQDIRYIRDDSDSFSDISYLVTDSWVYFFYYGLVLLLFFVGNYVLSLRMKIDSNSDLKRKKMASAKAQKFLKQAAELKNENTHSEYFSSIKKLLLNYVADKTNTDSAGYTSDTLKDIMKEKTIDDETIDETLNLIDKCDFYQYSNPDNVVEEMDIIYDKASDLYLRISKVI